MQEKKEKSFTIRNFQLILRPSTPVLKVLVIILVVFSTAAFIALSWVQASIADDTEQARHQAAVIEQENRELERKQKELGSVKSIKEIAGEELGLVEKGTVILKPRQ